MGEAPTLSVDLSSDNLPPPRLKPTQGVVMVPAYTDLKHMTSTRARPIPTASLST